MTFPTDLKYTKEHEWLRLETSEGGEDIFAFIGITDFAQSELGELVYVEVESVGDEVAADEVFGTVEAVKTTSELFMPIDGTVVEFNAQLDENDGDNPGLINEDCYGEGWIVKIKVSDPAQIDDLLDQVAYKELIGAE